MSITMNIADGGFEDFYPYELTLEEGFSRIPRAELTVFTNVHRELKDMRELLDRNVSFTVSQSLCGGLVTRSRFFHGVITSIADRGAASKEDKKACFRYDLTIESELANLRYNNASQPYYKKTPPDIIEDILNKYGIQGRFSGDYIDRSAFSKKLMFDKTSSSDISFVRDIMGLYGISWIYTYGADSELHFTEGTRFPTPIYEYSDKRKVPDVENFDFLDSDEKRNLWKMDAWRTEMSIGIEGMELTASYPEANYGSREWCWGETSPGKRYESRNSLFHGYERGMPREEIDEDIKRIIDAGRLSSLLSNETRVGNAENLILMPGLLFTLAHFHGHSDKSELNAIVTDSKLYVRAIWPQNLLSPPAGAKTGESLRVEFDAVDWGADSEKRFCGRARE